MIYFPERFLDVTSGGAAMMSRKKCDEFRVGSTATYNAPAWRIDAVLFLIVEKGTYG